MLVGHSGSNSLNLCANADSFEHWNENVADGTALLLLTANIYAIIWFRTLGSSSVCYCETLLLLLNLVGKLFHPPPIFALVPVSLHYYKTLLLCNRMRRLDATQSQWAASRRFVVVVVVVVSTVGPQEC
jgi:hypothetical protein